jgi:hypothetical protein
MLHLLFVPVLLVVLLFAIVVRVITAPFRMARYRRWYGRGWGYGRYAYGPPRGMGLLTVLALVALERLFGRRY